MAATDRYFLVIRPGAVVGPHKLDSLREWVERGVIGTDWQVCREGQAAWTAVSEIPRFGDYTKKVRVRLDDLRERSQQPWWLEPVTDKQLAKIRYFEIPFAEAGLTKGRASELIDAFVRIDPEREAEYQNRPSTAAQAKQIRALGGDPSGLSYIRAGYLIEELTLAKEDEEEEKAWNLEMLDDMLNDEDVREVCGYKKLTKAQVKQIFEHLTAHFPNWENESRFDLGELVYQVLAARPVAPSPHAASPQTIASVGTLPNVRPVPPKSTSSLPVAIAVVLGVIGVGAYLTYFRQPKADTSHLAKTDPLVLVATPAVKPTATIAENFQAAVAASEKRALAAHPQLGVAGSPLNRAFLAEYEQMVKRKDPQLNNSSWPEMVVSRCIPNANR